MKPESMTLPNDQEPETGEDPHDQAAHQQPRAFRRVPRKLPKGTPAGEFLKLAAGLIPKDDVERMRVAIEEEFGVGRSSDQELSP